VLIQTRNPLHPAIAMAARHDVEAFVEHELGDRRQLGYPPFRRIALVRLDATDAELVEKEAKRLAGFARQSAPPGVEVVGPAPAPIARVRNRYRYRFMLRCAARPELRRALNAVATARADRRVRLSIDIDPVNMM
jgi:primosomal protein N' (replication factor Y)